MMRSSTSSPMPTIEAPLAAVAHDAGAANLLFHFLRDLAEEKKLATDSLRLCVSGPAAEIAARLFPGHRPLRLSEALDGARTLLSGTGWGSNIEHCARQAARAQGIFSIAVIDHWVNYAQRFAVDGVNVLPDEAWVFDEYALALTRDSFPALRVTRQANAYLAEQLRQINRFGAPTGESDAVDVLYLLEPVRQRWDSPGAPDQLAEWQALDYFMEKLPMLTQGKMARIRLRQHPSEAAGKYDEWLARQTGVSVTIDSCATLAESLARAHWVVGIETYALTVAVAAGRCAASSLPPWAPALRLPQAEIVQLRNFER